MHGPMNISVLCTEGHRVMGIQWKDFALFSQNKPTVVECRKMFLSKIIRLYLFIK
jgi:hypothetical protein